MKMVDEPAKEGRFPGRIKTGQ